MEKSHNDSWDSTGESDEVYIRAWEQFSTMPYAKERVPEWHQKLHDIDEYIQSVNSVSSNNVHNESEREEWMILSDLRQPFNNNSSTSTSSEFDWQSDRQK